MYFTNTGVRWLALMFLIEVVKVKEFRNRPGAVQRVPGGLGSRISWHLAREGGEVSLTHWPPLPPGIFLVLIFARSWVNPRAMVRLEGNMSLKNPVTPPGIDPGIVRLVAQCLNHYATTGLHWGSGSFTSYTRNQLYWWRVFVVLLISGKFWVNVLS